MVALSEKVIVWRKVLGSFQVTVPVSTKQALLEPEERLLSVLRWIGESIPHSDRWYPVFHRYIEQTAIRVNDLGGNASHVGPSSSGDWKAAEKCKTLGRITSILMALFLAAIGALGGIPLFPILLGILFIGAAAVWVSKCHPKLCRWLKVAMAGLGIGAAILAVLWFAGVTTTPQLVPILCASVALFGVSLLTSVVKKCF